MKDGTTNIQAQFLRGEKWFYLMSEKEISDLNNTNSSIPQDVEMYLETKKQKEKEKEEKKKSKGKK